MKATIITIGDEILIGQIVDTNSAWISARLNDVGIKVWHKISIGDDSSEITDAIDEAMRECEVTIVTGGLGPTKDDITKKTLSKYFGCGLVRHQLTFDFIEQLTSQRGFAFNQLNQDQALVPECCTVLMNANGTAPGMWFEKNGHILVSLPGVPFEMKALMDQDVMPRLSSNFDLKAIIHRTAITFGMAESALALKIEEWEDALPDYIKLAYLPNASNIKLRLSAYEVDRDTAQKEFDRQFAALEKIIPEYMIGYGDATIASAVADILTERGLTLAIAESCTGGAVNGAFTAIAGASKYLKGGVVAYSNEVKSDVLGVNAADIEKHGAVSETVARQMAEGVRRVCKADYAIATTGVAGPDGGTLEKPVGTVWIAVASNEGTVAKLMSVGVLREQNIQRSTSHAINTLRLLLTGNIDAKVNNGLL